MTLPAAASPRRIPVYGVDTMLFVYHFEEQAQFGPAATRLLQASDLRATYTLRTPDALHLATAIVAGAEAFVTEDRRLSNIPAIRVIGILQAVS
jgi:predicted nucleic acid-binding protein